MGTPHNESKVSLRVELLDHSNQLTCTLRGRKDYSSFQKAETLCRDLPGKNAWALWKAGTFPWSFAEALSGNNWRRFNRLSSSDFMLTHKLNVDILRSYHCC
jgi:hypothetical protein